MRIQVDPERLVELSGRCLEVASGLMRVEELCRLALASLDWEVRQRAGVEERAWAAMREARALSVRAEEMARFLRDAAERFAEADRQGFSVKDAVLGASAPPPFWQLPEMRLGGLPFLPVPRVVLPAAGAVLGGLTAGGLGQAASEFIERVWNWLHGYGWKTNGELLPPPEVPRPTSEADIPKGRFADLIRSELAGKAASPAASPQPASAPGGDGVGAQARPETAATFGHPVPLMSQQRLKYGGRTTQYGCTAASTAMVLGYWHSRNPGVGRLSAQEILDANVEQGTFKEGSGLSLSNVHDEVERLGYSVVEDRINTDFETLKRDVEQGPVIAIVKLGMRRSGQNHAVVVTGISDDGRVAVNDPWDGQAHIYSVEEFLASWGADFGGMKNMYTVIRP